MPSTRKLAAIMFTDIAGYTALMQKSEQSALETRSRHRAIFEPTTAKYGGQIIQYYGDGTLSIFDSTVAAVNCGIEMQHQFMEDPAIPVRVGIHTGDIILSDDDIIGDSVNLAARIESLGVPGSVLISGKVAEEIKNQDGLPVQLLGSFHFKNDARKREAYAMAVSGLVVPDPDDLSGKLEPERKKPWFITNRFPLITLLVLFLTIVGWRIYSTNDDSGVERLAVLPFVNRMNDPNQEYIVQGVHEALIGELQRSGLLVKARSSTLRYQDAEVPLPEIARELGVQGVINASVFRADDTLGLNIRLVHGATENLLWSQSFEVPFQNIMNLYSDVTRGIASEIRQVLTPKTISRLEVSSTVDPEALKAYFKGQQYWNTLTRAGLDKALEYFELARRIDPGFAPAYAGIAAVWGGRLQQGYATYEEARPFFEAGFSKAHRLGGDLPEVQFWTGAFRTWWDWNWSAAEEAFEKSLVLNPNYAEAHAYYAHYLVIMNRNRESLNHMQKALDLDPLNPLLQALQGMVYNFTGRHDEVISMLTQTLKESPNDPIALSTLRTSYHLANQPDEAFIIWKLYYEARKDSLALAKLDDGYQEGGYPIALQRLAEWLIEQAGNKPPRAWQIATLYTRADRPLEALKWLEEAYKQHDANMPYISTDPIFDPLRQEPKFHDLLNRMGLPNKGMLQ